MTTGRRGRRIDWRRRPKSQLTTSLIDVDIALTDIVFESRAADLDFLGVRAPASVVDYAIEGVVRGTAVAAEEGAEPALVYLSGYAEADRMDRSADLDQRSVCYIANDNRPDHAWRTHIYIEQRIFRRLMELYASRRIDAARISIVLHVLRDPSGAVEIPASSEPLLRMAADPNRRHSRAQLMSVETSLAGRAGGRASILFQAAGPARVGRRDPVAS